PACDRGSRPPTHDSAKDPRMDHLGPEPATGTARAKPATIRDVAAQAGASHQTVSRVPNDHPNITAGTRARVLAAMAALRYRRNHVARTLANGRSGTIGVISTDSGRYGPPKTLRAIEVAGRDAGYFMSTINLASVGHDQMRTALAHL